MLGKDNKMKKQTIRLEVIFNMNVLRVPCTKVSVWSQFVKHNHKPLFDTGVSIVTYGIVTYAIVYSGYYPINTMYHDQI